MLKFAFALSNLLFLGNKISCKSVWMLIVHFLLDLQAVYFYSNLFHICCKHPTNATVPVCNIGYLKGYQLDQRLSIHLISIDTFSFQQNRTFLIFATIACFKIMFTMKYRLCCIATCSIHFCACFIALF